MCDKNKYLRVFFAFVHLFLINMHTTTCQSQPNYENIYNHYAATCGLHFCDASMISLTYFQNNLTNLGSVCPACHCNDCILNTNCCPDFGLLHHREKCMNDVIYNPYNLLSDVYFSVIDKCPPNTPPKIRNICEKETDLIQNLTLVPVTSQNRTTYRNVYCGQCHGETDLEPWTIDINCQKFADFNFLSSFAEIAETIKVKMCTVRYVQQNANNKALPCNRVADNLIGRCNMTGTWSSYDLDIDWACNHFQLPFDKYKSIFCLMCNPPLPDLYMDIVSTCNITDDSTKVLENACEMYQQGNVTFPFKNIFCYLCNRHDDKDKYNDINGYVSILFEGDRMVYRMEQLMFRNDFLTPYLSYQSDKPNTDFKLGNRLNSSYEFFDDGRQVNVANLMTLYSLAYGPNLCGIYNTGPKTLVPYCSCHETCISHHTCCVDFELDQLLDCLDGHTVSGICRYTDEGMNSYCERRGEVMYDLPVSRTDTKNHYKNIFCALCADNKFNFPMRFPVKPFAQDFFHPWDIEITCAISNPLPIYYQLSMTDIFKSATRRNCEIKFKPARGKAALCDDKTIMINSCNVSGTWSHLDADVLWACEKLNTTFMTNFRGFRNVFCILCNPGIPLQPIPLPTKTTETINRVPGICISCISSAGVVTTFRALFQISNGDDEKITECSRGQVLDTLHNKCRDVTCSPGYILLNSTCEPILPVTKNLGYLLPIRLDFVSKINPVSFDSFLQRMETAIANYLKRYLKLNRDLHFISADLITNSTCIINETVGMEILASIEVFIDEVVSRKDIERKLANISGELVNVTGYDNINLTISLDYNAINTKSKINNIGQFTGLCYLSTTDSDFKRSHMYYKFNLVSNLLFCKQVVLDKSEVIVIFNPTTSVTFVSSKVKIDQGHFRIAGNGTVRICVDTLLSLKEPNVPMDKIMSAILTTATIISMICLTATFVTYCLFPSLRSVPGKNNMSLVFSLFCLQAVYTISTHKIEHLLSCQVIGIIIHYFLLSYFACLSVCTFHMLKAFSSITGPYSTGHGNRTVLVYCLFSYCTPTIIIIVNIVVTFSLADNIGYGVRGYICFVKYSSAVFGTVIIPISFICVCNVAFFVMTMRKISSTPKIQRTSSHKTTHDNSIVYIKLFSITGITWVFPIIDAFLPMTSLTVMFSLLNVLQGVYIFLSYICNTRVRRMYRNLCGCYTDGLDSNFTGLTNSSQVLSASSVKYLSQQNTKCIRESKI